jgi:hypothetical protein
MSLAGSAVAPFGDAMRGVLPLRGATHDFVKAMTVHQKVRRFLFCRKTLVFEVFLWAGTLNRIPGLAPGRQAAGYTGDLSEPGI